jgi:hypothetical protein
MSGCSAVLFRRSRHGRRAAACARIAATFAGSEPARVPRGRGGAPPRGRQSKVASDSYRFQLLTGCLGVEICGQKLHEYPPIRVGDVDHRAGRVLLRDTKSRSDHKLLLSRQALAIAKRNCTGRKADEPRFPIRGRQEDAQLDQRGGANQGAGPRAAGNFCEHRRGARVLGTLEADDESSGCRRRDARALRGQE